MPWYRQGSTPGLGCRVRFVPGGALVPVPLAAGVPGGVLPLCSQQGLEVDNKAACGQDMEDGCRWEVEQALDGFGIGRGRCCCAGTGDVALGAMALACHLEPQKIYSSPCPCQAWDWAMGFARVLGRDRSEPNRDSRAAMGHIERVGVPARCKRPSHIIVPTS